MDRSKKYAIIQKIAERFDHTRRDLGKTAMMKYLYLLQRVYKLPLNYSFDIYTYGPYTGEVMADIDFTENNALISVTSTGKGGYDIRALDKKTDVLLENSEDEKINEVLTVFGKKSAKELELLSTIVYLYHNYHMNRWENDVNTISNDVREIKPRFDIPEIKNAYQELENLGILQKSITD